MKQILLMCIYLSYNGDKAVTISTMKVANTNCNTRKNKDRKVTKLDLQNT